MACWRTKAAISLKRVKTEEKLLWTAYRNSPTIFRTVPSRTPYGLPFPKTGGLQLSYPLLCQEQVKLQTSNLAGTFTRPIQVKAHSKFRKKYSVGVSRDCSNFLSPPIISGTLKATDFKFGGYIYRAYKNKSPIKILQKRERGRIQELPNFWGIPYYLRNG